MVDLDLNAQDVGPSDVRLSFKLGSLSGCVSTTLKMVACTFKLKPLPWGAISV